jgi:hypothetical protein
MGWNSGMSVADLPTGDEGHRLPEPAVQTGALSRPLIRLALKYDSHSGLTTAGSAQWDVATPLFQVDQDSALSP